MRPPSRLVKVLLSARRRASLKWLAGGDLSPGADYHAWRSRNQGKGTVNTTGKPAGVLFGRCSGPSPRPVGQDHRPSENVSATWTLCTPLPTEEPPGVVKLNSRLSVFPPLKEERREWHPLLPPHENNKKGRSDLLSPCPSHEKKQRPLQLCPSNPGGRTMVQHRRTTLRQDPCLWIQDIP